MKTIPTIVLCLALITVAIPAASAVEIAPFTGHRYGGSFGDASADTRFDVSDGRSYGLLFDFDSEPGKMAASNVTQSPVLIRLTANLLLSGS